MDAFQMELVRRLPLAQAVLGLLDFAVDPPFLDGLFQQYRGRCYQDTLRFSTLVHVVRDALLVHEGSGRKSIDQNQDDGQLSVHRSSVYRKLGNLPQALSQALLQEGTLRLQQVAAAPARTLVPCVGGMKVVAFDGKKIKKLAKRLKVARRYTSGSLLGGKLLVALLLEWDLALAFNSTPDGEANDVPLVPDLVKQVRQRIGEGILWMADRQFTDLRLFELLSQRQDHFLIRCSRGIGFEADDGRGAPLRQRDAAGREVLVQWGWLGSSRSNPHRRRYVRRITLRRPGEDDVILVTDLLEETTHPSLQLLELYQQRWGIEQCFQQITEVFGLRKLIGSTPRAVIFQSALCLLLYNVVQVVRSYAAVAGDKPMAQVSAENVFYDAKQELVCWAKLGDRTQPLVRPPVRRPGRGQQAADPQAMRQWLGQLLAGCWQERWIKRSDPKPRKTKRKRGLPGGHGSLWTLMCKAGHRHTTAKYAETC